MRDYPKEYDEYHGKPLQKKHRALRNAARAKMTAARGEKALLRGKDVDHKRPLSKGGTNARSNLRVTSVAKNRGRK